MDRLHNKVLCNPTVKLSTVPIEILFFINNSASSFITLTPLTYLYYP